MSMRWCGMRWRSSCAGFAVPISKPRYTSAESTLTISTGASSARRMDRRSAGQRAQEFVGGAVEVMGTGVQLEIAHHRGHDLCDVPAGEQRRHPAQGEACGSQRVEVETRPLPDAAALENDLQLVRLELDDHGLQQMLRSRGGALLSLEFLVQDALVRGVHVHEHEAVTILRKNVDAVQLRQCRSERVLGQGRL